jgi:hypothetical protein
LGLIIIKKLIFAFVFLTIITTTACGDNSGNSITQADRTPVNTGITSVVTTEPIPLYTNPLIVPAETTPGDVGFETTPPTPVLGETTPLPPQTIPVMPAPQTETQEEFELREEAEQLATKQEREERLARKLESNKQMLEEIQELYPELPPEEYEPFLSTPRTTAPPAEPRTPIDPENSRQCTSSELEFRIEDNGEVTLVKFTPDPTVEDGKPVREVVVPDIYDYFNPLTKTYTGYQITKIDRYAFYDCNDLYSVVLGKNIHTIGDFAFAECDNLEALTISRITVDFRNAAYQNSPKFSIVARKYSTAETKAIDSNIPFTEME